MKQAESNVDNSEECQEWMDKGDAIWVQRSPGPPIIYNQAADCYRKAIDCDKKYAPAWVGLAQCLQRGATLERDDIKLLTIPENMDLAQEHVNEFTRELFVHALILDPECGGARSGLDIYEARHTNKIRV